MATTLTLHEAIARRAEAAAKLESASTALERGKEAAAAAQAELARVEAEEREWIARDARRRAERAVAGAGPAPSLIPTDKAFLGKRKAEVTLAAELQAVASLEAAEREAHEALAAAEAAAREAARDVLFAELRAAFESFRRQAREVAATREWLFAGYLSLGRDALTPQEWLSLDDIPVSSDSMEIGNCWADVPINQLEMTGSRDRPREARRRINALIPEFEARLAELTSGEYVERRQESAA